MGYLHNRFYEVFQVPHQGRVMLCQRLVPGARTAVTLKRVIARQIPREVAGNPRVFQRNQGQLLREAYKRALSEVDILLMPTCAPEGKALPHVDNPTIEDIFRIGFRHHWNTCPFNMTGHPSMSVPGAKVDGLPVGLLLTGRLLEDATVLRAAHAFESLGVSK